MHVCTVWVLYMTGWMHLGADEEKQPITVRKVVLKWVASA